MTIKFGNQGREQYNHSPQPTAYVNTLNPSTSLAIARAWLVHTCIGYQVHYRLLTSLYNLCYSAVNLPPPPEPNMVVNFGQGMKRENSMESLLYTGRGPGYSLKSSTLRRGSTAVIPVEITGVYTYSNSSRNPTGSLM